MRLSVEPVTLRLREPLQTAFGTLCERELALVEIDGGDGQAGRGEAAPLEPYDGVRLEDVRVDLAACAPLVREAGPDDLGDLRAACRAACEHPQALAAIDVALWDLAGRRAGLPVAELLRPGGAAAASVPVNALIGATDRAGAAAQAARAVAAGFRCVKLKVGVGDDAGRLAAVRAAVGAEIAIRIDANGAWEVEEAVAALERLAPTGIELCEEPVHGLDALRAVRARSPIPVAMDETAGEPGAPGSGAADAVCLKVARCGGLTGVVEAAAAARAAASDVYLASSLDGPVGIAAGLHAAAALGVLRPCGLATLGLFAGCEDPPLRGGLVSPPAGPGLGAALSMR